MKKLVIGLTITASLCGGFVIAQSMTSGSAATQPKENTKFITEQEAKNIALKEVNGTITEVDFDQDDNRPHYEFEIQRNNEEINVDVDAKTGKVTVTERETEDKDKVANQKPVQNNGTASKEQDDDDLDDDVKADASQPTAAKPSATKQNESVSTNQKTQTNTADTKTSKPQAATTKTTQTKTTQTNAAVTQKEVITKAEAIKIASSVAKGTVTNVELDRDDDETSKYELEFKDGNVEYDVEVDAYTGKIIKVEKDLED